MKHEEISLQTKTRLSNALKHLMTQKPFSKIRISELIEECNINRKTFYYHFEDIFQLLQWTLEQEAVEVVKQYDLLTDFEEAFTFVLNYIEQNAYILNCALDSLGREGMKSFLAKDFNSLMDNLIREKEQEMNIVLTDEFRAFLCEMYMEGLAGILVSLLQKQNQYMKKQAVEYMTLVIDSSLPAILATAPRQK